MRVECLTIIKEDAEVFDFTFFYKDATVGYYMFFQKVVGGYFGQFLQYWITIYINPLERIYEENLNLFYYKNHICYIKDLNSYLYSNNKSKKRKYFCNRCLNSFLTQENLDKHKYLCIKYNKRLEKIMLPKKGKKLHFKK